MRRRFIPHQRDGQRQHPGNHTCTHGAWRKVSLGDFASFFFLSFFFCTFVTSPDTLYISVFSIKIPSIYTLCSPPLSLPDFQLGRIPSDCHGLPIRKDISQASLALGSFIPQVVQLASDTKPIVTHWPSCKLKSHFHLNTGLLGATGPDNCALILKLLL